ncbi:MAG: hypothetical protein LJE65_02525 [Desulfobacteraceae bacterium]|jgi:hypothetical protein|nr:hypothetical protein [Desulfobacteraceae bacterium]
MQFSTRVGKWIACALVLLISACASAPEIRPMPPRPEGVEIPEYGIRFTPPPGWRHETEPPRWIARRLPRSQSQSVIASFSNKATTGFILISASHFEERMDASTLFSEIQGELKKNGEMQSRKAGSDPRRSYAFRLFDIRPSAQPQAVLREIILTETETMRFVIHSTSMLYLCGEYRACGLDVVLISDAKSFDGNFERYNTFVEGIDALSTP